MTEDIVLDVSDLRVEIPTARGVAHIVNGITFQVTPGESVAIVGESGSGKSMTALAIIGLIDRRVVRMSGRVSVVGKEISKERESALRRFRGRHIGMIFQEPTASLNPAFTIGRQLTEKMRLHLGVRDADARRRAHELLDLVRIAAPDRVFNSYPHQLSGGMCQRAMIAMALSCKPDLLIADEPTTALDVTTQAQIVDLVKDIQADMGLGLVWISHDLGVVAGVADRVAVMYAGEFVEVAEADELFARPRHPYTQGLLGALPGLTDDSHADLVAIPGLPPDPTQLPPGCRFWPRCPRRGDSRCETEHPTLREARPGHQVATLYDAPGDLRNTAPSTITETDEVLT
jgi:peptide/nickel transport system ATP-binding protein